MAITWKVSRTVFSIEHCALPTQLGFTPVSNGATIAIHSRHAQAIDLCLFASAGDYETTRLRIPCRTGDIHHGFVPGVIAGQRYGLRAHGPFNAAAGHLFDASKLLADPHAREIDRAYEWDTGLNLPGVDTAPLVPKSVLTAPLDARFEAKPRQKPALIYEAAVKALTCLCSDVPVEHRGTLRALGNSDVIAHLNRLHVSHIEILPVTAWISERHLIGLGLSNVWGYNPVSFLSLDPRLAPAGTQDLRFAADRLRQHGIGIIMDVVFNHTGESDASGPVLCLRGLDNASYYRHDTDDPGRLTNDTGCGNALACERPATVRLIMDALRHWWRCGVDGFRFDLASTLGRDANGFSSQHPLLTAILQDPELSGCLLIAEPWDAGPDGYQLGAFPAPFMEWNDRYRDDVRKFWRGDARAAGALARAMTGSEDVFARSWRRPGASVNYVAAHDGFTLADLVSYSRRHNEANGEAGRDGSTDNFSWNNGIEGPTDDYNVNAARRRDIRAMLATLFISRGTPMLLSGDETARTQDGNNNAYAQDKAEFALHWSSFDDHLVEFVACCAELRRHWPVIAADRFLTGTSRIRDAAPDVVWLMPSGRVMRDEDWDEADTFMMILAGDDERKCAIAINRSTCPVNLLLPELPKDHFWEKLLDSSEDATPADTIGARSVKVYGQTPSADQAAIRSDQNDE